MAAIVLLAGCAVASAQDVGAGKVEVGGWPGGGIFFTGGDDQLEVNFNNWAYGGGATFYLSPMVGVEVEASYGLGLAQGVNYKGKEVFHVQGPNTLQTSGNIVLFPGGSQKQLVPYVTGGVGLLTLISRNSTKQFGITEAENHMATNVGGGVKIFRGGDAKNWGFRVDYRYILINKSSDAAAFFAKDESRQGQRVYIGMFYTMKR
jgi:hypothetical protein